MWYRAPLTPEEKLEREKNQKKWLRRKAKKDKALKPSNQNLREVTSPTETPENKGVF